MPKPKSATIVNLQQVRDTQPARFPDGTLVPPWMIYEPQAQYLLDPRRVIKFPVKGSAAPDKP